MAICTTAQRRCNGHQVQCHCMRRQTLKFCKAVPLFVLGSHLGCEAFESTMPQESSFPASTLESQLLSSSCRPGWQACGLLPNGHVGDRENHCWTWMLLRASYCEEPVMDTVETGFCW